MNKGEKEQIQLINKLNTVLKQIKKVEISYGKLQDKRSKYADELEVRKKIKNKTEV